MSNEEALQILSERDRIGVNIINANDAETTKYNNDSVEALSMAIAALKAEPCEAVSREAVLDAVKNNYRMAAIEVIENLPPVTPKQRTGHWRHYEGMLICSECGTEFYDDIMEYCGDDVPKWCPDCGCRMFEPQEGESE